MNIAYIYVAFLVFMSVVAFVLYTLDKQKSRRGKWRISEKTLLLTSFLGGAMGGLLSMLLFRHKTRHGDFTIINVCGIIWQLLLLLYFLLHPIIL